MAKIPVEFISFVATADSREWCICPKPEGSEYPPGIWRPKRTPEQRAADQAAGLG